MPSKGRRQAAQGAAHAPNENMLTYQCTTLGATVFLPCLCTTVEVAVIRQGSGKRAVRVRPTGDRPAPPGSLGFDNTGCRPGQSLLLLKYMNYFELHEFV